MVSRSRTATGFPTASEAIEAKQLVADAMTFCFGLVLSGSKNVLDVLVTDIHKERILSGSGFPYALRWAVEGVGWV